MRWKRYIDVNEAYVDYEYEYHSVQKRACGPNAAPY